MPEAVKKAQSLAKKGDIVLLSPAAASFGLFQNEFDRGEKFKKAVGSIKKSR
jgi:UDP-N-acetylmuramoylalanine--D-glutamate ligase